MTFGETMRELRTTAGVTLTDLAVRLGVSTVYLSRVELGKTTPPTVEKVRKIADALRTPSERLLIAALVERGNVPVPTHGLGMRVAVMAQIYPDEAEFRRALALVLAAQ